MRRWWSFGQGFHGRGDQQRRDDRTAVVAVVDSVGSERNPVELAEADVVGADDGVDVDGDDVVPPGCECPVCGNADSNRLIWVQPDFEHVECTMCGTYYDPNTEYEFNDDETD